MPDDGAALYGERVRFIVRGLGLTEISARGYGEVIDHVVARARELAAEGAQAVSLMGTSLSLISCGGLLSLEAIRIVEARLGVPVVSSSPVGFWDVMRVAGLDSCSPGHGRLFEI